MMSEIYRNIKLPCNWTLCQYWAGEIILKHPSLKRGIYIKAPWYRHQDKVRWESESSFHLETTVNPKNEHGFRPLSIRDWVGAKVYSRRFAYVTRYGHTQVANLKAYRTRTRQVRWWLRWLPFAGYDLDSLIIEFSDEMGSERGSWKGGVIGAHCQMNKGETPYEAINRFLNDAQIEAIAKEVAPLSQAISTHCDELVAAAYLDAAQRIEQCLWSQHWYIDGESVDPEDLSEGITKRTPDDARAALTAYGERMQAEGALEAQTKIARLTEALKEISSQKKTSEFDTEYDVECADFEAGYDTCIDRARAIVKEIANE